MEGGIFHAETEYQKSSRLRYASYYAGFDPSNGLSYLPIEIKNKKRKRLEQPRQALPADNATSCGWRI
ncbi:hypothetical protein J2S25_001945 [Mesobacillus stamsii]|uniref:Uncharacterized protein n=1 Tax=Mesobacillus stamsii TaxID=225347 RepID=A0ABU0FVF6_9BACI|nr:hypothetical protein [Mesobacillus stamsii]MDQ0413740.1 hypothetical protein [Mesobacillus stamsii]